MKFFNSIKKTDVQIVRSINVDEIEWCDEAVLICVKNGRGTLTHRVSGEDEEYLVSSQLLLNDKPIIQGKYPICPTCEGMLATGYGIENINSQELQRVRECMNMGYIGIIDSAKSIKPLLGLLDDGYYVLADVPLFPSDGQGTFFYSVPNELTYNVTTCEEYYDSESYCCVDGFPAYIYPTQSSELINEDRVEEYIKMMKDNSNPPRGLAYYERGFICALLDGHHKACAASALGKKISCLTIISATGFHFAKGVDYVDGNTLLDIVRFSDITIDAGAGAKLKDYRRESVVREKNINLQLYNLTGRNLPKYYINSFPKLETMVKIKSKGIDIKADAIEYAKSLISACNEESAIKLNYLMKYLYEYRKEEAYSVAKMILNEEDEYYIKAAQKSAIQEMLNHRNEETQQYMIDYLANHNSKDQFWDLVSSYWD